MPSVGSTTKKKNDIKQEVPDTMLTKFFDKACVGDAYYTMRSDMLEGMRKELFKQHRAIYPDPRLSEDTALLTQFCRLIVLHHRKKVVNFAEYTAMVHKKKWAMKKNAASSNLAKIANWKTMLKTWKMNKIGSILKTCLTLTLKAKERTTEMRRKTRNIRPNSSAPHMTISTTSWKSARKECTTSLT